MSKIISPSMNKEGTGATCSRLIHFLYAIQLLGKIHESFLGLVAVQETDPLVFDQIFILGKHVENGLIHKKTRQTVIGLVNDFD